ncbi:MAG: hypothetical protein C0604_08875 [Clostridiales bacterium]|nr:MAG: hypothetical protein C0604_08875 [Clostridiales bacterium]
MFTNLTVIEAIKLFAPMIAIQIGLIAFCLRLLVKNDVRTLSKPFWAMIIIFLNIIGPVFYLLFGRVETK